MSIDVLNDARTARLAALRTRMQQIIPDAGSTPSTVMPERPAPPVTPPGRARQLAERGIGWTRQRLLALQRAAVKRGERLEGQGGDQHVPAPDQAAPRPARGGDTKSLPRVVDDDGGEQTQQMRSVRPDDTQPGVAPGADGEAQLLIGEEILDHRVQLAMRRLSALGYDGLPFAQVEAMVRDGHDADSIIAQEIRPQPYPASHASSGWGVGRARVRTQAEVLAAQDAEADEED